MTQSLLIKRKSTKTYISLARRKQHSYSQYITEPAKSPVERQINLTQKGLIGEGSISLLSGGQTSRKTVEEQELRGESLQKVF
jgi:hypothetical protein